MAAIQSILLSGDRKQFQKLQKQIQALQEQAYARIEYLEQRESELQAELETVRQNARQNEHDARNLQTKVEILERKNQADSEGLIARLTPVFGDIFGRKIRDSRDEMADALGPIISESIRVQIRNSRQDMVDALYPIIGSTVQKAVAESAREFQRNIDARLKVTFGTGALRTAIARMRGVSPSELAMRDALPFTIREIFLIQQGSGLLLAHTHPGSAEITDSDLISGMLTAIRDFVQDSFGQAHDDDELDEIQYGSQRIIIQSGRAAYMAIVISGVEPEGFRAQVRQFVSELHVAHEIAFRDYNGNPTTLPHLQPKLARFIASVTEAQPAESKPATLRQKLAYTGIALLGILFLGTACFYLQFTVALMPIAFPRPTPTNTPTPTATLAATNTPTTTPSPTNTLTPTNTPTTTPSPTNTPTTTPTTTPSPTSIPTQTFTPTFTPPPPAALASRNVWARGEPQVNAPLLFVIPEGEPLIVRSVYDFWMEVEWASNLPLWPGKQRVWVPSTWVTVTKPIPETLFTPTPER